MMVRGVLKEPVAFRSFVRALAGMPFYGFDVVEVSPPYDAPAQVTALHAAAIAYEMLAVLAVARQR